jgi:hypothetical protein
MTMSMIGKNGLQLIETSQRSKSTTKLREIALCSVGRIKKKNTHRQNVTMTELKTGNMREERAKVTIKL